MLVSRLITSVSNAARRLLIPPTPALQQQAAGFKVKKWVKLRCEHCYFIRVNGRLHVECPKHPKHKQREDFDIKALW